ncbi:hypothetical protein HN604_03845 [archaeon]|jgi:uncharacterized membrane protein|nr:hypothetical protein [archaeon]MBT6182305.1 hypothetical protein [archaeon]MBT6606288.1 hypothetical protein [archaeon]MBT7251543.1 hypothetical protein [archaeon]MBT7661184.1 hypothetical protein [archaeon]
MDNKKTGYLLLGVAVVIVIIIYMFNSALHDIVNASCSSAGHGDSCPMYDTVTKQTNFSVVIVGLIILIAAFLISSKPQKEIIFKTKTVHKRKSQKKYNTKDLRPDEKKIFEIIKEQKTIFQADLIEKTNIGKVKMSRILEKLEGKGFIEKKRRGMTNVVVLVE